MHLTQFWIFNASRRIGARENQKAFIAKYDQMKSGDFDTLIYLYLTRDTNCVKFAFAACKFTLT